MISLFALGLVLAKDTVYTSYLNKNCYNGHGGRELDTDASAPAGQSVAQCEALCTADPECDCVTLRSSDGKCWKRASCSPAQFDNGYNAYNVYMKQGTPAPTGPPGTYTKYPDKNCYDGHGGTAIDAGGVQTIDKWGSPSAPLCKARCDSDPNCSCVTFHPQDGRCWKRASCVASQFEDGGDYLVFLKNGGATLEDSPSLSGFMCIGKCKTEYAGCRVRHPKIGGSICSDKKTECLEGCVGAKDLSSLKAPLLPSPNSFGIVCMTKCKTMYAGCRVRHPVGDLFCRGGEDQCLSKCFPDDWSGDHPVLTSLAPGRQY